MSITTTPSTRSTRRLGVASTAAATFALLLLGSACGVEKAADQAPESISGAETRSAEHQSPSDRAECLVNQAKTGIPCPDQSEPADEDQPQFLAPSGRPVPLPGQSG
jgi:cell division protein FtsN